MAALTLTVALAGGDASAESATTEPAGSAAAEAAGHGRLLGTAPTQYPDWFKHSFLDIAEDVDEAREAGRKTMLFFHQDGCPYCNALIEEVFSLREVEAEVRAAFDVIEMNMWGDREVLSLDGQSFTEKTFSSALKVQFTPTLVFLGDRGEPVLRLNGYLPADEFRAAVHFVRDEHYREGAFRDYLRSRRDGGTAGAASAASMVRQPFFMPPPYILTRDPGTKPLAVFFERSGCERCEALHRGPLAEAETRALLAGFDAVQLDAWSQTPLMTPDGQRTTAREWADRLGVSHEPTIVFFDAGGTEVIRSEAFFKTFHTQSMMDYVLSGAWRDESSFQRYISARADAIRERGIDVDIWR